MEDMSMRYAKSIALVLAALAFTACGTNPVTGKKEMQFVSESQELQIGEKNYAPSRQAEGGDMEVMPELTAYINEVGQKLAAVADRKLPYEFNVLNNSVPNAWALPGGKIAVNRGLLTELKNESELAAVLGHEIVHAAARHGAKAQERGTLMQVGMVAAQVGAVVGGVDSNVAGAALAGTGVGLQMVQMKYGRDQELESDLYGMKYMKRAGYDPVGAITLQETFVRLSSEQGGKSSAFERLFASHPPSPERVAKNKETAAVLGLGGELGEQTYQTHIASLTKAKPAYEKYDKGVAALKKKEYIAAKNFAIEANKLLPQEGRFHELLGEIELDQKHYKEAIPHYEQAIQFNPNYYGSYLGGGIAQFQAGNKPKAQEWLKHSNDLLPTKPAAYYLGTLAKERGDMPAAMQHFKAASGVESSYSQLAAKEVVTMDLSQHPEEYIATGVQIDTAGRVVVIVKNKAPVALTGIQVTPVLIDSFGRVMQTGTPLQVGRTLEPGQQVVLNAGGTVLTSEQLQSLHVRVDAAKVVEASD
jgi:beta-barrel assembly-enhancing protease